MSQQNVKDLGHINGIFNAADRMQERLNTENLNVQKNIYDVANRFRFDKLDPRAVNDDSTFKDLLEIMYQVKEATKSKFSYLWETVHECMERLHRAASPSLVNPEDRVTKDFELAYQCEIVNGVFRKVLVKNYGEHLNVVDSMNQKTLEIIERESRDFETLYKTQAYNDFHKEVDEAKAKAEAERQAEAA